MKLLEKIQSMKINTNLFSTLLDNGLIFIIYCNIISYFIRYLIKASSVKNINRQNKNKTNGVTEAIKALNWYLKASSLFPIRLVFLMLLPFNIYITFG